MNTLERNMVNALLSTIKTESFTDGYVASDTEAMGLLLSKFFHWDGVDILKAASSALEDANFHTQAGQLDAMVAELVKVDDSALIDRETRSALFAALNEVYGSTAMRDRSFRLAKLNKLAGRDADNPITSLSDRYNDMTVGDAGRVFEMLHEIRELTS